MKYRNQIEFIQKISTTKLDRDEDNALLLKISGKMMIYLFIYNFL
jgi:hypothetical protein